MNAEIPDIAEFKRNVISAAVSQGETQVELLEVEFQRQIEAAPEKKEPYSDFSKRELIEQKARLAMSDLKTPLAELKKLRAAAIPPQVTESICEFSLFDLSVQKKNTTKILTFFVLPIESYGSLKTRIVLKDLIIHLTNKKDPWFSHKLKDRKRVKSTEVLAYKDNHPWADLVPTGEMTEAETFWISRIY